MLALVEDHHPIKSLLANTTFELADIADRFGFEHPEYMNVLFKRETGVTPAAYRESLRKPGR